MDKDVARGLAGRGTKTGGRARYLRPPGPGAMRAGADRARALEVVF